MANNGKITRIVTQDNFVTEKIDVIQNNLLGVYEDDGDYVISPQIVNELLKLHKTKRATFANSVFCVGSLLGYGELVFELTFDSKTNRGKSVSATLYLLEGVDKINGYLQNTLKTKLETYSDSVENFIEETYKHFNIDFKDEEEDDAEVLERKLDEDLDNEDSFIIAKKQYSLMLEKLLEEKFLDAYGKYFTARMSILTKMDNEFTNTVLGNFNKQYSLIQNVFLKEKNYKILNELLDKCFEEVSGINPAFVLQEKQYAELIQPSLDTFVDNVTKLREKYSHKALHMLAKEDRKKVSEILEEHTEMEERGNKDDIETKQSVENIVNSIPQNTYTLENDNATEKIESEEESNKETHFIEEILNKNQNKENEQDQNFYDAFKEHYSKENVSDNKVVDTSRSESIDPSMEEETKVTLLKERMSRLEKFKQSSGGGYIPVVGPSETDVEKEQESKYKDNKVSDLFDTFAKEKNTDENVLNNKINNTEIDNNISMENTELILEQQRQMLLNKKNPDRSFDFYDFEK